MQVELIGCTSAGKSTITKQIIARGRQRGLQVSSSYDYVLGRHHLGWIKPHSLRMLLLNSLALGYCLGLAWRHWALLRFVFGILRTLPATVSRQERIKIARITLRNLGIHAIIARAGHQPNHLILADEGAIQVVHYLFVHLRTAPPLDQLAAYLQRTPLPNLVLYYRQPRELLLARTLRRGHKRIPERTAENVAQFIDHAIYVFEHVADEPIIRQRTLVVDGQAHHVEYRPVVGAPPCTRQEQALVDLVTTLIGEEMPSKLVHDNKTPS